MNMLRILTASFMALLGASLTAATVSAPPVYLTRAEAAMLLIVSGGLPVLQDEQPLLYPDVLEGEWYVPYLKTAVKLGMFDADPRHGLLHPHYSVSRAEFLKMMTIAYGLSSDMPYGYTDIPPQAWYRSYAGLAYREHLFWNTKEPLRLQPDLRITQDEAVNVVTQVLQKSPHLQKKNAEDLQRTLLVAERPHFTAPDNPSVATVPSNLARNPAMVKEAMRRFFMSRSNIVDDLRLAVLQRVNAERRNAGIHILRHNSLLALSAQAHAKEMYQRGYFSHFTPEGLSYVDRIRTTGYLELTPEDCPCSPSVNTLNLLQNRREFGSNYVLIKSGDQCTCQARFALGENIAKGQLTATQVVNDWMQSELHRRNILNGAFDEIGIGVFGDVWVQNFGRIEPR
jgi:uncharacterized protein YkwD